MKKLLVLSCALSCLFAPGIVCAQNVKIATVDMEKIFKAYYKTKDAEVRINEARISAEKELHEREDAYKATIDEIRRLEDELKNPGLSDAKREEMTKTRDEKYSEYKNLESEIQQFHAQRERDLQTEAAQLRADIVADIMKLVNAKIQTENYDYVFDKSGMSLNAVPVMIYARASVDFSDDIIKALNANRPRESSSPASSSATPKPSGTSKPGLP